MSMDQDKHFCTFCQKQVTYHHDQVNHRKEFLRTVFTLGLWLPIWIFMAAGSARVCDLCGHALPEDL